MVNIFLYEQLDLFRLLVNRYYIVIFYGFAILLVIISYYIKIIKRKCNYKDINLPFIYIFDTYESIDRYLQKKSSIHLDDIDDGLKKCFKIINEWEIGDFTIVKNEYGESLNYVIKNLQNLIYTLVHSDKDDDIKTAKQITFKFAKFLNNQSKDTLEELMSAVKLLELKEEKIIKNWIDIIKSSQIKNIVIAILSGFIVASILFLIVSYTIGKPFKEYFIINHTLFIQIGTAFSGFFNSIY